MKGFLHTFFITIVILVGSMFLFLNEIPIFAIEETLSSTETQTSGTNTAPAPARPPVSTTNIFELFQTRGIGTETSIRRPGYNSVVPLNVSQPASIVIECPSQATAGTSIHCNSNITGGSLLSDYWIVNTLKQPVSDNQQSYAWTNVEGVYTVQKIGIDAGTGNVIKSNLLTVNIVPNNQDQQIISLSISPNPCVVSTGKNTCQVDVSLTSPIPGQVWIKTDQRSEQLFGCGSNWTQVAPWIALGQVTEFTFYATTSCSHSEPRGMPLASVSVTGTPEGALRYPSANIGLNVVNLAGHYLAGYQESLNTKNSLALAETQGVKLARKAINEAYLTGANSLRVPPTMWNKDEMKLWMDNPEAYWQLIDLMMADLNAAQIRIVPCFYFNLPQFPALAGETITDLMTNKNSKSYQLLDKYTTEFITRYKNNTAVSFYEIANELNLVADLDLKTSVCSVKDWQDTWMCYSAGNFTTNQMIGFMTRFASRMRVLDPTRAISSGFSDPRASSGHLRANPVGSEKGPDWTVDNFNEFKHYFIDTHQGMDIMSVHLYKIYTNDIRPFVTNAIDMIAIYKQIADQTNKKLYIGEFQSFPASHDVNPTEPYTYTKEILGKILDLGIPYSSIWVWQFDVGSLFPGKTDLAIADLKTANDTLSQPTHQWKLDEPQSSPTALNAIKAVNNGLYKGTNSSTDCLNQLSCRTFNGISDAVVIPHSPSLNPGNSDFTLTYRIKLPPVSEFAPAVSKRALQSYEQYASGIGQIDANGNAVKAKTMYISYSDGKKLIGYHTKAEFADNKWHQVAAIKDSNNNAVIYVDGILQDLVQESSGPIGPINPDGDLIIGANNLGMNLKGSVSDVRIYNHALTEQEIKNTLSPLSSITITCPQSGEPESSITCTASRNGEFSSLSWTVNGQKQAGGDNQNSYTLSPVPAGSYTVEVFGVSAQSGTIISSNRQTVSIRTANPFICYAENAHDFQVCINRVNTHQINEIVITSMIPCDQNTWCSWAINNHRGALTIRGESNNLDLNPVGFKRTGGYDQSTLIINNSTGPISIKNFIFDENKNIAQGAPKTNWHNALCTDQSKCEGNSLMLINSSGVSIDGVRFLEAKNMGLFILNSSSIFVRNSLFQHSWRHGIWIPEGNALFPRGIHIENNSFIDIRNNAIVFTGYAPDASDPLGINTITGNYFSHNHNAMIYYVCGSGNEACAGGQMVLERHSDSVLVKDNEFTNGIIDEDPAYSGFLVNGIEFSPTFTSNITLLHNYIHDQTGPAIAIDGPVKELRAINNVFQNVLNPPIFNDQFLALNQNNCTTSTPDCTYTKPIGNISATPVSCKINARGRCTVGITWSSQSSIDPLKVLLNHTGYFASSSAKGGSQNAPGISIVPAIFDLYSEGTLLSSVQVTGTNK